MLAGVCGYICIALMFVHMCLEVQGWHPTSPCKISILCWSWASHCSSSFTSLAIPCASEIPVFSSVLWDCIWAATTLWLSLSSLPYPEGFYVDSGDPNTGPRAFVASALSTRCTLAHVSFFLSVCQYVWRGSESTAGQWGTWSVMTSYWCSAVRGVICYDIILMQCSQGRDLLWYHNDAVQWGVWSVMTS